MNLYRKGAAALLAALLFCCACQGAETPHDESPAPSGEARTLSIYTLGSSPFQAPDIATFGLAYPNATVQLRTFDWQTEREKYYEQLKVELMSGTAPDLFDATGIRMAEYADSGYLANFNAIIEQDETFDREDCYANVFDALAYKGGLYRFPLDFGYSFISVNESISNAQTAAFRARSAISYPELIKLYNGMTEDERKAYELETNFRPAQALVLAAPEYIDFEAEACDFNNASLIQLLKDSKAASNPERYNKLVYTYSSDSFLSDTTNAKLFAFYQHEVFATQYFLPYEENYYTHSIPLTDAAGNILVQPYNSFAISAASPNRDLAWAFLKFAALSGSASNAAGASLSSIPICRSVAQAQILQNTVKFIRASETHPDMPVFLPNRTAEEKIAYAEEVWQQLDAYNQAPMAIMQDFLTDEDTGLLLNEYDLFYKDMKSAEDAAAAIQNKMSLKLKE